MEQQVQKLRNLFISDLESYSSQIEKDLRELFIGVSYLEEKDRDRILAFSFEYDPEDFVISLSDFRRGRRSPFRFPLSSY
jgi:hypothetical protein